jgi:hypothetical protein
MIHLSLLQGDVQPVFTRMPAAEFSGGRTGEQGLHIHEIQISGNLTVVMDEQQLIELVEKALDALPPMDAEIAKEEDDDKGEGWKRGGEKA